MDTTPTKNTETKASGRRYATVDDLLKGEISPEIGEGVRNLMADTRLTRILAATRVKGGMTQDQLGQKMNPPRTQSAVSKLEAGRDEDLTLSDIREYSKVLNERIGVVFGAPLNHVEAIKANALEMRRHMLALAKLAQEDGEMEKDIQAFFGEAFFNILTILSNCQGRMPDKKAFEFKIELIDSSGVAKQTVKRETRELVSC